MKPSILISVPAFGHQMYAETAQSLYCVAQGLTHAGIKNAMCWVSASDIVEVRNLFLTKWYDGHPDFTHLLMVDADMEFPVTLIRDMLAFDKPLTGCLYARRQHNEDGSARAVGRSSGAGHTVADMVDGFIRMDGTGAGVMLVKRALVKKMLSEFPDIIDTNLAGHPGNNSLPSGRLLRAFDPIYLPNGTKLSEDLAFCERWRRCGGEVWANVNHMIGHIGPFNYAIRYADFLENKAREAKEAA